MTTPSISTFYGGDLVSGNADTFPFVAAFGTELNSLAAGSAVMSTIVFDNTGAANSGTPDLFGNFSFVGALATAAAIVAGNSIGLSFAFLQGDGVTYGDGRLTAGSALASYIPVNDVIGGFGFAINASTATDFWSDLTNVMLVPQKFRLVAVNNMPGALASSGNMIYLSSTKLVNNAGV